MSAGVTERLAAGATTRRPRWLLRDVLGRRPTITGLAVGLVAWWASLGPSLLPRSWPLQAAISGICLAVGYAVGTGAAAVVGAVARRVGVRGSPTARRVAVSAIGPLAGIVVGGALVVWPVNQDAQRALVGLPPAPSFVVVPLVVTTLAVAVVLGAVGRLLGHALVVLDSLALRALHRVVWRSAATVALVAVLPLVSRDIVASGVVAWADDRFGALEPAAADLDVTPPASPSVSGSAASSVDWDTLGYEGRRVVAGVSTLAELRRTAADPAAVRAPVRVYVGERSAPTLAARVALAVRELERTGGFDRAVLAVVATTGRGGVADDALRALEHLHAGDTAVVALQYGHLPSWLTYLVDRHTPAEAAAALWQGVRDRWLQLPPAERPRLVLFGESLGAYGAEAGLARDGVRSPAELAAEADAVLLAGPTAANPVRAALGDDPGPEVAVAEGKADLRRLARERTRPRVLYLEHPSDPVRSWELATIWRPPAWTRPPNGVDVPDSTRWFPFVTWLQTVGDLVSASAVPSGHGHDYDEEFLAAWEALVPPPGWTGSDHQRLTAALGVG